MLDYIFLLNRKKVQTLKRLQKNLVFPLQLFVLMMITIILIHTGLFLFFSPFLLLILWSTHSYSIQRDTPEDILHTLNLGACKYGLIYTWKKL